ncbi:MAG TPA: transporter substrate-binding domain-containing protein [Oligoflexus sp.]|uniref:substrate-binding periplasmic protein n=1 Tax=Oligoflexus sp. TaxID=1971216 RepID=UPI002D6A8A49|nr:transporter substrate-binding domain-containing protein [Oligoflexus sp.]HYX35981.1 transporter substrate-binding domain-containing protein [Oligoflexus sp.]
MKLVAVAFAGFMLLTGLTAAAQDIKQPLIINDPEWPPYFFAGRPDYPPGIMKEILTQCFTRMKMPFEFKFQPIERMQVGMEQGTVDFNLFSYKKEREKVVEFGKEVMLTSAYVPIVRADSDITIKSISDFDRYRLGHTIGLRYSKEFYDYILKRKAAQNLDESSKEEFNIRKLDARRIDIFVSTDSTIVDVARQIGLISKIKLLDFNIQKADYFIAISRKSPRIPDRTVFIHQLEDCIRGMRKSGETCELYKKYDQPCPWK